MPRLAFAAARAAVLGAALAAAGAQAPAQTPTPAPAPRAAPETAPETAPGPEEGGINAVDWIRGALANQRFDPEDRARARNFGPELEGSTHWRSSIFDGRRTRATSGTGLTLPNFPRSGGE